MPYHPKQWLLCALEEGEQVWGGTCIKYALGSTGCEESVCVSSLRGIEEAVPWHTAADLPRSFPADRRVSRQQGSHSTGCISFLRAADGHVTYADTHTHTHTHTHRKTKLTDEVLLAVRDVQKMFGSIPRVLDSQTARLHFSSLRYKAAENNQQPSQRATMRSRRCFLEYDGAILFPFSSFHLYSHSFKRSSCAGQKYMQPCQSSLGQMIFEQHERKSERVAS